MDGYKGLESRILNESLPKQSSVLYGSAVEDEPGAAGGALLLVPVLQQQRVRVVGQGLARAADHLLRHHRLRLEQPRLR